MMRISKAALAIIACLIASGARADWTAKDASGATITFKNSGTCSSVVCVVQQQPVDSTGAAFGVTGNPIFTSFGTGVTLPAFGSTPTFNLGTLNGAGTAANQSTMIGVLGTVTTAHGCATAGYTVIGCLGQIDDDIKGAIPAGTNIIGKVGIDQTTPGTTNAVAVAQIGANTVLTGNGVTGTGSQRVTIASDNSAVAGMGVGATGSAVPANAIYNGANSTNGLTGLIVCDQTAKYDASTTGSTQMVALSSGKTIYICGFNIGTGGTATNVKLVYGTGTNCATGSTDILPAYQLLANAGIVDRSPFYSGLKTAASNALCINASAANAVQGLVYFAQF